MLSGPCLVNIYLGGGIAPKIAPAFTGPDFMNTFTAKGRLSPLVAAMPVRHFLKERAGLFGAARSPASRQLSLTDRP